jgi:hypothetical protein
MEFSDVIRTERSFVKIDFEGEASIFKLQEIVLALYNLRFQANNNASCLENIFI